MIYGAGLTAGLLGQIGHALDSHALKSIAKVATWALPFEALYQAGLHALVSNTTGPHRRGPPARPVRRRRRRGASASSSGRRCTSRWRWRSPSPPSRAATSETGRARGASRASAPRLAPVVDTHAHLCVCEPADGDLVGAARQVGVRRILTVGMDEASNREAIAAAEQHEEVFASVGRHPNGATGFDGGAAEDIEELAAPRAGGGDRRDRASTTTATALHATQQRAAFEAQIAIARRAGSAAGDPPARPAGGDDALSEAFATLAAEAEGVTVILHCCSVPPDRVGEAAERGWYCSFAGNVTYPNAGRPARDGSPGPRRAAPGGDRLALPGAAVGARQAEPAGQRGRGRGGPCRRARRSVRTSSSELVEANAARVFGW